MSFSSNVESQPLPSLADDILSLMQLTSASAYSFEASVLGCSVLCLEVSFANCVEQKRKGHFGRGLLARSAFLK